MLAGLRAEPLVALRGGVEAVGGEGIAELAQRTAVVVVAALGPLEFMLVTGMRAQVDHPPRVQLAIDEGQGRFLPEGGIPRRRGDLERDGQ